MDSRAASVLSRSTFALNAFSVGSAISLVVVAVVMTCRPLFGVDTRILEIFTRLLALPVRTYVYDQTD